MNKLFAKITVIIISIVFYNAHAMEKESEGREGMRRSSRIASQEAQRRINTLVGLLNLKS